MTFGEKRCLEAGFCRNDHLRATATVRRLSAPLACALFAATPPSIAAAQTYPVKPIRLVNGFPAGGGTDIMARLLAPKMVEALGQQIIIENRTGASTNIAMEFVVKAAPDGYTLLVNSSPIAINMSLYKNLPFDTQRDLAAISLFAASTNVLVVHPSLPARSVKDLIALARAKPDDIKFSSGDRHHTTPVGRAVQIAHEYTATACAVPGHIAVADGTHWR